MSAFERTLPPPARPRGDLRLELWLLAAALVGVPVAVAATIRLNPWLSLVLAVTVIAVALAWKSIIYPLALGGVPALVVGLYGSNPLPTGVIFAATSLWLVLGVGFAFVRGCWPREASRLLAPPIALTVLLAGIVLVRYSPSPYASAKLELFLAQNLPLLLAGMLTASSRGLFRRYVLIALGLALANGALLGLRLSSGNAQAVYSARFTISESFAPIQAGRLAAEGVLYSIMLVLAARDGRSRVFGLVSLPFLAIALLGSGSRGPTLALLLASLTLVALSMRERQTRTRLLVVAAGVAAALLAAVVIVPADAVSRSTSFLLGNSGDLASNGRSLLWDLAGHLFATHPLAGVGLGGFALYNPIEQFPHNILLEAAAELGIVGLAVVAGVLVLAFATAIAAWRLTSESDDRFDAALVAALLVAATTNAMLSDAIESTGGLWLAIGLVYGVRARIDSRRTEAAPGAAPEDGGSAAVTPSAPKPSPAL